MTGPYSQISRVTRSKAQAQALYDRLSGSYTWIADIWERRPRHAGLSALNVLPGECVLEIGPGKGTDLLLLARKVSPSGHVFAVDISPKMIAATKSRLKQASLENRVSCARGDAFRLPFRTASFDAIYASFTLELFDTPEIPHVLAECYRALRPEGRICLVSLSKEGRASWLCRLYDWSHRRFPNLVDCRPIFAGRALSSSGFQILHTSLDMLFGLPVEIVLARPAPK